MCPSLRLSVQETDKPTVEKIRKRQQNKEKNVSTRRPSHVHAGSRRVGAFGDGVVDPDVASVDLHARDGVPRLARVFDILERDEAEAATATRLAVVDDRNLLDVTVTTEHLRRR